MAEGDGHIYAQFFEDTWQKIHDLGVSNDEMIVALMTAHTPDYDADGVWADVSADEIAGSGYVTPGDGLAIASNAITVDSGNGWVELDGEDASWAALNTGTPSHGILYNTTPTSPADPLIGLVELNTTAPNGGQYNIVWSAEGILHSSYG